MTYVRPTAKEECDRELQADFGALFCSQQLKQPPISSTLLLRQPLLQRRRTGSSRQLEDFDLGLQVRDFAVDDLNVRGLYFRFAGQRIHFKVAAVNGDVSHVMLPFSVEFKLEVVRAVEQLVERVRQWRDRLRSQLTLHFS